GNSAGRRTRDAPGMTGTKKASRSRTVAAPPHRRAPRRPQVTIARLGVPMHKRLLTVALGLSLGLGTTTASSRTYDFERNTWSADDSDRQTSASAQRQRVAYAYRSDGEETDGIVRR